MLRPASIALVLTAVALGCAPGASAAPGDLDQGFGQFGIANLELDPSAYVDSAVGGRGIVAVGSVPTNTGIASATAVAVRLDGRGRLDPGFGDAGVSAIGQMVPGFTAHSVAVQPDRRILIGGSISGTLGGVSNPRPAVVRLLAGGALDLSFGSGGVVSADPLGGSRFATASLALDDDGRILVGVTGGATPGFSSDRFVALRLLADGRLDRSFADDGVADVPVGAEAGLAGIELDDDGRVYLGGAVTNLSAGFETLITGVRLTASGALDRSFGDDGIAQRLIQDFAYTGGIAVDRRHRLAIAASLTDSAALFRFTGRGRPDRRFGDRGIAFLVPAGGAFDDVALADAGRLIAVGQLYGGENGDGSIARVLPNGRLDRSFGGDGIVAVDSGGNDDAFVSVSVQPNGRPVAAGYVGEEGFRGPSTHNAVIARMVDGGRPDQDGDGIRDRRDRCPALAAHGHHGCPFAATRISLHSTPGGALRGFVRSKARRCWAHRRVALRATGRGRDPVLARTRVARGSVVGGSFSFRRTGGVEGPVYARVRAKTVKTVGLCGGARSAVLRPASGRG